MPRSPNGGKRFGSFYVAEPDSNRPTMRARLLSGLRRKGRSREDAEDLIQEGMLRLHLYARKEVVVNEEAFLRRAIHNLAIDRYRRDRSLVGLVVQIDDVDRQHPLIAPDPTPDRILDSQQRLDQLTRSLDAVSQRTREIYLAHQSGYNYTEIAADMGIAKITIKRHIARAHMTVMSMTDRHGNTPTEKHRHPDVRAEKGFKSGPLGS